MDTSSEHAARYSQEDNFFAGCFSSFFFVLFCFEGGDELKDHIKLLVMEFCVAS